MSDLASELRSRLAEDSPHRLAYYEMMLNRLASEVGGNAKFHAERTASLVEEIDGLRKELKTLAARVDRIAEFLNKQKGKPNDSNGTGEARRGNAARPEGILPGQKQHGPG